MGNDTELETAAPHRGIRTIAASFLMNNYNMVNNERLHDQETTYPLPEVIWSSGASRYMNELVFLPANF